jgi:hypothetical protein
MKFVSIPYVSALFANLKGKKLEPVVAVPFIQNENVVPNVFQTV